MVDPPAPEAGLPHPFRSHYPEKHVKNILTHMPNLHF